jgi:hypothetical protein
MVFSMVSGVACWEAHSLWIYLGRCDSREILLSMNRHRDQEASFFLAYTYIHCRLLRGYQPGMLTCKQSVMQKNPPPIPLSWNSNGSRAPSYYAAPSSL